MQVHLAGRLTTISAGESQMLLYACTIHSCNDALNTLLTLSSLGGFH